MFTVKWIAENGSEMMYPARDVSFTPAQAVQPSASGVGPVLSATAWQGQVLVDRDMSRPVVSFYVLGAGEVKGDVHCTIDSGQVYVMNAAGRTVADYHLSSKEFPHGIMPRQQAA